MTQETTRYIQVGRCLVKLDPLPDGGAVSSALDPESGEFRPDGSFFLDFYSSRNDPEPLDEAEFRRRVAFQIESKQYLDEYPDGEPAPPARRIEYEDGEGLHRRQLGVGEWVIGRAADCDVVVKDFGLSLRHAKLVVTGDAVRIVDLKSKGGTQVNAVPVTEARLSNGDQLLLGKFPIRFAADRGGPPVPAAVAAPPTPASEPSISLMPDSPAPEAWRREVPERGALVRRIAAIRGHRPESVVEDTRFSELCDSFTSILYLVSTIEAECAVKLPLDELQRVNTVGELVDLVCRSLKVG
jgi:acyl carrier protein